MTEQNGPQKENGYTSIAHEIIEDLVKLDLSGQEFRVLLYIFRKTYGYHKLVDFISLSQIKEHCEIDIKRASKVLKSLRLRGLLAVVENDECMGKSYRYIKDKKKWNTLVKKDESRQKRRITLVKKDELPSSKKTSTKDNIQKIIKDNRSHQKIVDYFCDLWKSKHNSIYVFDGGKDGQIIKTLLQTHGEERLKKIIDEYINTSDQWILDRGHTLGILRAKINEISAMVSKKIEVDQDYERKFKTR